MLYVRVKCVPFSLREYTFENNLKNNLLKFQVNLCLHYYSFVRFVLNMSSRIAFLMFLIYSTISTSTDQAVRINTYKVKLYFTYKI